MGRGRRPVGSRGPRVGGRRGRPPGRRAVHRGRRRTFGLHGRCRTCRNGRVRPDGGTRAPPGRRRSPEPRGPSTPWLSAPVFAAPARGLCSTLQSLTTGAHCRRVPTTPPSTALRPHRTCCGPGSTSRGRSCPAPGTPPPGGPAPPPVGRRALVARSTRPVPSAPKDTDRTKQGLAQRVPRPWRGPDLRRWSRGRAPAPAPRAGPRRRRTPRRAPASGTSGGRP